MIRTCPRCELRFRSESEMKQHLAIDHDVAVDAFDRFSYRSSRAVAPLYPDRPDSAPRPPRRYLVVANQTLGGDTLRERVRQLAAEGPATFHVVVPSTHSAEYLRSHTYEQREIADVGGPGDVDETGQAQARWRLRETVEALRQDGVDVHGEVGVPDPFRAVEDACERDRFDEVLLSTLPHGFSRWLDADLPRRITRRLGVPVTTIVADGG